MQRFLLCLLLASGLGNLLFSLPYCLAHYATMPHSHILAASAAFLGIACLYAASIECRSMPFLSRLTGDYRFYVASYTCDDAACSACEHVSRATIRREAIGFAARNAYRRAIGKRFWRIRIHLAGLRMRAGQFFHRHALLLCLCAAAFLLALTLPSPHPPRIAYAVTDAMPGIAH